MKSTVKILHLIPAVEENKGVGGAETLLLSLLKKIDRRAFYMMVAYPPDAPLADEFKKTGAQIVPLSIKSKLDLPALLGTVRLIRKERVSLVHSHYPLHDYLGGIAAALAGVPLVFTRHLSITEFPIHQYKIWLYRGWDMMTSVKSAKKIVAASRAIAQDLIATEQAAAAKIEIIYAGLDIETYARGVQPGRIRREFAIDPQAPLIGIVGRINAQKAHQFFLQAAREVIMAVPGARFLIVGDGPLKSRQEALARDLGIAGHTVFCGYRADIPNIMADIDISVLSSVSEALAVVNLEAMLMGKPVACFDVGGISELVENGRTGILVPPRDAHALAQAIIYLAQNPESARKMGALGRQRVQEYFTLDIMVRKHEALYRSLCNEQAV
ncbi:MAG: glycosyltransferase [Candidatus Omnitrophica bacterium]|nr:glycosyltransferase [Candidatus Omnitrophota bacterium]